MADTSPLVNLDLINKIYKTINAQINERVYDPQWNSEATLGSSTNEYKSAYVSGNISAGTLNNLTLATATAGTGFTISGGTTMSKTLTVTDDLTVSAATEIIKGLTVGDASTGAVIIKSAGTGPTTITGPSNGTATLKAGTCLVETDASEDPTAGSLLKIKAIPANEFLAGPGSGTANEAPTYRKINSNDLADAITGTSPIAATNTNNKITVTHDKKGPDTSASTSRGDTNAQSPGFGGTFKVTSATVDIYGHTTTFNEHNVTIPSSVASQTAKGLMSSTDKTKLDGIAEKAEVNQNAFSNVTVGSATIKADSATDTLTLTAGDNIELTADTTNDKITISSSYVAASASTSGIVDTGNQTFAGVKTFSDETDSNTNRTTGAVIISGGLSVGKSIYAAAVHNAVWNDLADCIEVPENTDLEFGYCYSWNRDKVEKTSRKSKNCIGIHSNTAGLFMGEKPVKTIQAAVAGFALAYIDRVYPEGTPLTWSDDGKLTKCSLFKRLTHPERVIATFYKEEKQESWNGVKVNNRHWVKVR